MAYGLSIEFFVFFSPKTIAPFFFRTARRAASACTRESPGVYHRFGPNPAISDEKCWGKAGPK